MKLKEFRKKMAKNIFTTAEARLVAFPDPPKLTTLQLHQWKVSGDLLQLKRGLFMFADTPCEPAEIAKHLYSPCYFSLEYVMGLHGIIPEAVFSYTLVTTKSTRHFKTPCGYFIYQSIKRDAFTGFDTKTLLAFPEKALVDYFYLKSSLLHPNEVFWEESRLNSKGLNFKKIFRYAQLFKSKKLISLLTSFYTYAKSHENHH